jgi:hypothetical protein
MEERVIIKRIASMTVMNLEYIPRDKADLVRRFFSRRNLARHTHRLNDHEFALYWLILSGQVCQMLRQQGKEPKWWGM